MGILEAIVVVYLRRIYYPDGFGFPLAAIEPTLLRAELIREAMTLVMLALIGWMAAEDRWSRLLAFTFAFGIWDIAYYAGLKLFLDWPVRLLDPDILFLIPSVWIGPVLAPLLVAAAWTAAGLMLHRRRYTDLAWGGREWAALILGHGLILASFLVPVGEPADPGFLWGLFAGGYGLGLLVLAKTMVQLRRIRAKSNR